MEHYIDPLEFLIAKLPVFPPANWILPVWQPQGVSTHEIARRVAEKYGVKTSHTGTLDPLAEGVVIILLGEDRLKKYEYAKWPKIYEFEIVFGIETDTYDGMGTFKRINLDHPLDLVAIENTCSSFVGSYKQRVPYFSAIKVRGRSLHKHARENAVVVLPGRSGLIYDLKLRSIDTVSTVDLANQLIASIKKVEGDFRQKDIIQQWQDSIERLNPSLQTAQLQVKMTKGLYVRSLVQDICVKLNTVGITNNIVRTANGAYTRENSIGMI